jgi:triacylglycerol esterase/lipase EstA (alpha/beta hydrolase family)
MQARLQRVLILSQFLLGLAWGFFWLARGRPGVASVALLLPFMHAPVLALEFALLALVQRRQPGPHAGGWQLLRAWAIETWTGWVVFGWRQPFRSRAEADYLPADVPGRRALVLVHGFACNRGIWNGWMRRLRARGRPFVAVDLEPLFGSIDDYGQIIDAAVKRVRDLTGAAPVIVAHSMGGLATRAWMASHEGAEGLVHAVVTLGTPHRGTWLGRFARAHNARQMRLDGEWTLALASREMQARLARFTCYWSECDNIVFPSGTATLPYADNRRIPGVPHVAMLDDPRVFAEVMALVDEAG